MWGIFNSILKACFSAFCCWNANVFWVTLKMSVCHSCGGYCGSNCVLTPCPGLCQAWWPLPHWLCGACGRSAWSQWPFMAAGTTHPLRLSLHGLILPFWGDIKPPFLPQRVKPPVSTGEWRCRLAVGNCSLTAQVTQELVLLKPLLNSHSRPWDTGIPLKYHSFKVLSATPPGTSWVYRTYEGVTIFPLPSFAANKRQGNTWGQQYDHFNKKPACTGHMEWRLTSSPSP